jgi:hypothetical protein
VVEDRFAGKKEALCYITPSVTYGATFLKEGTLEYEEK